MKKKTENAGSSGVAPWMWVAGGAVLLAGGGYFYWQSQQEKKPPAPPPPAPPPTYLPSMAKKPPPDKPICIDNCEDQDVVEPKPKTDAPAGPFTPKLPTSFELAATQDPAKAFDVLRIFDQRAGEWVGPAVLNPSATTVDEALALVTVLEKLTPELIAQNRTQLDAAFKADVDKACAKAVDALTDSTGATPVQVVYRWVVAKGKRGKYAVRFIDCTRADWIDIGGIK
jgi:hypothetical protein